VPEGRVEVDEIDQLIDSVTDPGCLPSEQPGHGGDVVGDRPVGEQADLLDDVADAAPQLGG